MKKLGICLILLILCLCACGQSSDRQPQNTSDNVTSATVEEEAPKTDIALIQDGKSLYTILRAEECSAAIKDDAINLNKRIKRFTSVQLGIKGDWVKNPAEIDNESPEILIGVTNRQATQTLLDSLPDHSWGIRFIGNKLVICGTSETMTALALYAFENKFLLSKDHAWEGNLVLPSDLDLSFTSEYADTMNGVMASSYSTRATIDGLRNVGQLSPYVAAQGAATDGTYFYNILIHGSASPQVGVIVKSTMDKDGFRKIAVSAELPLDHGNDMCYNSRENCLVVTNMVGKTITFIDPDTLTILRQIQANDLPGTPYGIAYVASQDCYVVLAGGRYNIVDSQFHVKKGFSLISYNYVGQGMDADDKYIYVPGSPDPSKGTKDNVIIVYDWDGHHIKNVYLDTGMESETLLNVNGQYYINFNSSGAKIYDLSYVLIYQ